MITTVLLITSGCIIQNWNQTNNVRNIEARFSKPLLAWKSNKYYIFLCACVHVWVDVSTLTLAYACAHVTLLIQHAAHRHIVICNLCNLATFFGTIS
jgi:hypothetical protein